MGSRLGSALLAMAAGIGLGIGGAAACPGASAPGAAAAAASAGTQMTRATAGPPPLALAACSGRAAEQACTTTGRHGEALSGYCRAVPEQLFACVPSGRHRPRGAGAKTRAAPGGG